jgi:hypothetical protein
MVDKVFEVRIAQESEASLPLDSPELAITIEDAVCYTGLLKEG